VRVFIRDIFTNERPTGSIAKIDLWNTPLLSTNGTEDKILNHNFILQFLNLLSSQEKDVIYLTYYEEWTGPEIGEKYNLTRERIRQIKQNALNKGEAWIQTHI